MESTAQSGSQTSRQTNEAHSYTLRAYKDAEAIRSRLGLDAKNMARFLGIDEKTYFRRAGPGELKGGESLKVDMLDAIITEATRVLHNEEEALHWILTPIISLDHERPIDLLSSISGYERVKNTLARIEYGMY